MSFGAYVYFITQEKKKWTSETKWNEMFQMMEKKSQQATTALKQRKIPNRVWIICSIPMNISELK